MGLVLAAATLLGGVAAVWFFWDKIVAWFRGRPPTPLAPEPARINPGATAADAASENQAAVARTLLEEVKRIRLELGPRPQGELVPLLEEGQVIPRLTTWLQPIIPQIAPSNAAIVGAFMTLERSLETFDDAQANFHTARHKRDKAMAARDGLYELYAAEAKKPGASKPEEVGTYMEASRAAQQAEQSVSQTLQLAEMRYRTCHSDLDALEELLKPVAAT